MSKTIDVMRKNKNNEFYSAIVVLKHISVIEFTEICGYRTVITIGNEQFYSMLQIEQLQKMINES